MTKGSDRRKQQLRKLKQRRARKQAKLVSSAYRAMLDSQIQSARVSGVIDDRHQD